MDNQDAIFDGVKQLYLENKYSKDEIRKKSGVSTMLLADIISEMREDDCYLFFRLGDGKHYVILDSDFVELVQSKTDSQVAIIIGVGSQQVISRIYWLRKKGYIIQRVGGQ